MTLRTNATRPGQRWLALVVGVVALMLGAAGLALALISDPVNPADNPFDITVTDTSGDETADLGFATVRYIGSDSDNSSSGTGLFDPFLRLQGAPTEEGYNTCSQSSCGGNVTEFDTKTGSWTKAILASAIPQVDCGGDLAGTDCWELFVDINEGNSAKYVSLNEVEVWLTTDARITDYDTDTETGFAAPAEKVYDFSGDILIHDVNQGSGRGDLLYLIPVQDFESNEYFVLYSEWGTTAGTAPDNKTWGSEGGFEEWKVRKAPNVSILKTADQGTVNAGSTIGFTITVSNTGAAAASNVTISDPLPAGGEWTLSPAFTGCTITGAVGTQVLNCSFSSLASGGTIGPIHITSPTTAADCGTVNNLATVSVGGTAVDDDDASIIIQCGALKITKTAKHADISGNTSANLVASFTVVDANGVSHVLTTNAAGLACQGGVAIGLTQSITETSVPSGYSAPTIANVTVASGSCSGTTITGGTSIGVANTPLTTIAWSVDSLRNGATSTVVTCRDAAGAVITGYPVTVSDGNGSLPNLPPTAPGTTVTCAFVVDP